MNQEISGDLENTRCSEIIKILSLGKRTGRLMLNNGAETGTIFFQDGNIIHAQCGPIEGLKAIYEQAIWASGRYEFHTDDTPNVVSVQATIDEILAELAERIRQMDRISALIPSSGAVYTLDADIREKEFTLKSIQWRILVHIDGFRSIANIAQIVGLSVSDTMKVFYTLIKLGLLKDAEHIESFAPRSAVRLPDSPFIAALNRELTMAMGPVAPVLITETAQEMGLELLSTDMGQRAALIETLSGTISEEEISLEFINAMTGWLRREGV